MTNYEKIKSMSLDGMCKFLDESLNPITRAISCAINSTKLDCDVCPYSNICSIFEHPDECRKALKNWLKAESEEE